MIRKRSRPASLRDLGLAIQEGDAVDPVERTVFDQQFAFLRARSEATDSTRQGVAHVKSIIGAQRKSLQRLSAGDGRRSRLPGPGSRRENDGGDRGRNGRNAGMDER
jgi:hypothetical protein